MIKQYINQIGRRCDDWFCDAHEFTGLMRSEILRGVFIVGLNTLLGIILLTAYSYYSLERELMLECAAKGGALYELKPYRESMELTCLMIEVNDD